MIKRLWFTFFSVAVSACSPVATPFQGVTHQPITPLVVSQPSLSTELSAVVPTPHLTLTPSPASTLTELPDIYATQDAIVTMLTTLGAFDKPLPATLAIDGREQVAGIGSHCWQQGCEDGPVIETASAPLFAHSPLTAHLRLPLPWPPSVLSLVVLWQGRAGEIEWTQENPVRRLWDTDKEATYRSSLPLEREQDIVLSLDAGIYVLDIFAQWEEIGDVSYGFLVEVQP